MFFFFRWQFLYKGHLLDQLRFNVLIDFPRQIVKRNIERFCDLKQLLY